MQSNLYMLRTLKGAPLAVFVCLYLSQRPLRAGEIADYTGYTDKPVSTALKMLKEMNAITRNQNGWYTHQLPLPFPVLSAPEKIRNFSDSSGSSESINLLTTTTTINLNKNERDFTLTDGKKVGIFPTFSRNFSDSLAAALAAGIREPKASALAALPHVTPEYIRAHVAAAAGEENPLGAAIYRIEHGWTVPDSPDASANKYTSGEFADFVEH